MDKIALTLASTILNFEIQKKVIIEKDVELQRLCFCRKTILEKYTIISQLFFIRVSSKIIKYFDERRDDMIIDVSDLIEWYTTEMYTKMFLEGVVSPKMLLLFKILQSKYDQQLFATLNDNMKQLIHADKETSAPLISAVFEALSDSLEESLLNIISIKIDCLKLSNAMLVDNAIVDNFKCVYSGDCTTNIYSLCMRHYPTINWHETYYKDEEMHFFIDADFDEETIPFCTNFLLKYHSNTKNIMIILDSTLLNEFDIHPTIEKYLRFDRSQFKGVEIR